MDHILMAIQQQLYEQHGDKVDLYYEEDRGAIAVPHGLPLHPNNVIFAMPDFMIRAQIVG